MTLAACLFFYGVLTAIAAPRMLIPHSAAGHAPRLGVACWIFAVANVVVAWLVAAVLVLNDAVMAGGHFENVFDACMAILRSTGLSEDGLQFLVLGIAIGPVAALLFLALRVIRLMYSARRASRRHSHAVWLVGRPVPRLGRGTVVLDVPERAAYCLSANRGTIVVTAGAMGSLSGRELDAVLAHERAHLAGRHHLVLTVLSALRRTLGALPLFAHARHEVGQLLEMTADDAAVRRHGRAPLLTAMLAMSGAGMPEQALGASGVGVLSRARRLVEPASATQRAAAKRSLTAALTVLLLGPGLTIGIMAMTVCPLVLS